MSARLRWIAAAAALGLALWGVPRGLARWRLAHAPDILVVLVDSLRPDHLGVHGYARKTSPFLDAWAQGAGVYRQAFTHGTQTRIAMASLFTGTRPGLHRVRRVQVTKGGGVSDALSPRLTGWGRSLQDAGYETWGYSTNVNVAEPFGFAAGFERWVQDGTDDGEVIAQRLLADRQARTRDRPLFTYLHFMGVHSPYYAPAPYDRAFPAPPGRKVWASYHHDVTPADLAYTLAQYDGAILYQDAVLSRFLPAWESPPGRARVVIVLSDHGEEFLEHGALGHGQSVYDELARVVFMVKAPGVRPGMHDEVVTHVDAHRLVLDLAGAAVPALARGRPLALWNDPRSVYTESAQGTAGLRSGGRLLERSLEKRLRAVWYDLAADPGEKEPRRDKEILRGLQAEMDTVLAEDGREADRLGTPPQAALTPETTEALRALGYVD